MLPLNKVKKYCTDILEGKIPSGVLVKNAVTRFLSDLEKTNVNTWVFSEDAVNKVVNFIGELEHFTGIHAGKPFKLEPWQLFIVANLYGFINPDGTRRFQTGYIEVARKNGKTAFVGALALYHLLADGESGGEILFTANSLDQAKIGFNIVNGFAQKWDPDNKIVKQRFKDISVAETNSLIRVLAADSSKLDGYNCSFGVVDEYHSAPNSRVRDVIRSSMGMRENPLLLTITTAGFDKSLPCYDLRQVAADIASGLKVDDSFFGIIYSLDEEDDWSDPKNWIKSNPNLNITVKESFIAKQVVQATNNPTEEVGVKTKNLNVWCDSSSTWIPEEYIVSSTKKIDTDTFDKQDLCYVGVDLASNVDLTAVSYLYVKDDIYYFKNHYYIPKDTIGSSTKTRIHADKDMYREWVMKGYLNITPGNVTDYDYITHDLLVANEKNSIELMYYDRFNATSWAIQCTEEGLNIQPFGQTIGNFNNCTREFERLVLGGKVIIDDNPITRYCLRNVELRKDFNGNVKPNRNNDRKKIDGVIAMLQALAAYIEATSEYHGTQIF